MVIGIGERGIRTLNSLRRADVRGLDFVAVDRDRTMLARAHTATRVDLPHPPAAATAAEPDEAALAAAVAADPLLKEVVSQPALVFVVAGMGGRTGSVVAPQIAALCRQNDTLVIGIVTQPAALEAPAQHERAALGLTRLAHQVDSLLAVPIDRVEGGIQHADDLPRAYDAIDNMLVDQIRSVVNLLERPGEINLDFADVRTAITQGGTVMIGRGMGRGADGAAAAVAQACAPPFVEKTIDGAGVVVYDVVAGRDIDAAEVQQLGMAIRARAAPDANIVFGYKQNEQWRDRIEITLIAGDFPGTPPAAPRTEPHPTPPPPPSGGRGRLMTPRRLLFNRNA